MNRVQPFKKSIFCDFPARESLDPLDSNLCTLFLSKEEVRMPHGVKLVCYVGFHFSFLLPSFLCPGVEGGQVPTARQSSGAA